MLSIWHTYTLYLLSSIIPSVCIHHRDRKLNNSLPPLNALSKTQKPNPTRALYSTISQSASGSDPASPHQAACPNLTPSSKTRRIPASPHPAVCTPQIQRIHEVYPQLPLTHPHLAAQPYLPHRRTGWVSPPGAVERGRVGLCEPPNFAVIERWADRQIDGDSAWRGG